MVTVGVQADEQRRRDNADPEHAEKQQGAAEPLQVTRPGRARQVPDLRHREQAGLGQAGRAPDQQQQSEDQPDRARVPERVHPGQLPPYVRELPGDGVQHLLAQRRAARGDQAEDRHQDQQQREQGGEGRVRQAPGQGAPIVVAVFLDHAEREGQRPVTLLYLVDPPDAALDRVHRNRPACPISSGRRPREARTARRAGKGASG